MIPAGGDKSFYDSYKKSEAEAFKKAEAHLANKATQGGTDKKQTQTPLRRKGRKKLYTYPIPQGPSERTGDRLQIKCLQYEPPKGSNMTIKTKHAFKKGPDGEYTVIDMNDRERLKNEAGFSITDVDGNNIKHDTPIEISAKSKDTDSRLRESGGLDRLLKYIIELPIPQELSDSNSVTWGEDRVNALEMAALEVAQRAMASEGLVARARKAQRFLSQPFFVAEIFTGTPGKYVSLEDTIKAFKGILNGDYDHLPEQAFYMVGTIEEAVEKAKTL